jgi:DNA-binding NarL/FixJ family response regulator
VLVLSSSDEKDDVLAAIRAGATGYLVKTSASTQVADAIRRVRAGELVLPQGLSDVVLAELRR